MKQPAIIFVSLGVVAGVALGSWLPVPVAAGAVVVLALLTAAIRGPALLVLGALALGLLRITNAPLEPPPGDLSERAGRTVEGTGVVTSYPEPGSGRQRAEVAIETGGHRGTALIYAAPHPTLRPGDELRIKGKVQRPEPFDGFDYPSYLAKDGTHSVMYRPEFEVTGHRTTLEGVLFPVRELFLDRLQATFNEPAAGFLAAILIGDRTGIPDDIVEAFRATGTIHVMALSGYNISILVAALIAVTGRGRLAITLIFLGIGAFVLFVGPSATVVRAALMGSFMLLAQALGRPQEAVLGCVLTAALMLLAQPWALRYDLGFDLSFLATLGILLLEPSIAARFGWLPSGPRGIVSATVAASIPTLPLIALTFGTVSTIAPAANLIVVPTIPWLMLGGFAGTIAASVLGAAALPVTAVVQTATDGILIAVDEFARYPFALVELGPWRVGFVLLTVSLCLGLLALARRPTRA